MTYLISTFISLKPFHVEKFQSQHQNACLEGSDFHIQEQNLGYSCSRRRPFCPLLPFFSLRHDTKSTHDRDKLTVPKVAYALGLAMHQGNLKSNDKFSFGGHFAILNISSVFSAAVYLLRECFTCRSVKLLL